MKQSGTSGVYAIRHRATGRAYIGSTVDLGRRWRLHISQLNRQKGNKELQVDWNTFGPTAFDFQLLEEVVGQVEDDALLELERSWWSKEADPYNGEPKGRGRQSGTGLYRMTAAHRKAISDARKEAMTPTVSGSFNVVSSTEVTIYESSIGFMEEQ